MNERHAIEARAAFNKEMDHLLDAKRWRTKGYRKPEERAEYERKARGAEMAAFIARRSGEKILKMALKAKP